MAHGDGAAALTAGRAATLGRRRLRLGPWAPVVVLVVLCGIVAAINPNFLSFSNFVRICQAAMIPLVLGLGATFVILMGSIDLSVEGVLALGAVILSVIVMNGANGNDMGLLGIPLVLAVGALMGFLNGLVHVKLRIPSFMATLGMWFVGVGVANAILGGLAVRITDPLIRGLAIERFLGLPWGVWVALAALGVAWVIQSYTRLGRYMYALGVARNWPPCRASRFIACGSLPSPSRVHFYALGGVLAAAQLGLGNALIGQGRLFTTITAVVVGGTALSGGQGSVLQTLVGVLIVVVLANGMVLMGISPYVQQAVQGLMIIAAVALSLDRARMKIVK